MIWQLLSFVAICGMVKELRRKEVSDAEYEHFSA